MPIIFLFGIIFFMFGIELKYIHEAIYIAWLTVITVTPAGQQKLLLDYATKSRDSKSSHSTMNVEGQERVGGNIQGRGGSGDSVNSRGGVVEEELEKEKDGLELQEMEIVEVRLTGGLDKIVGIFQEWAILQLLITNL